MMDLHGKGRLGHAVATHGHVAAMAGDGRDDTAH